MQIPNRKLLPQSKIFKKFILIRNLVDKDRKLDAFLPNFESSKPVYHPNFFLVTLSYTSLTTVSIKSKYCGKRR
jgi:hypothetical protein